MYKVTVTLVVEDVTIGESKVTLALVNGDEVILPQSHLAGDVKIRKLDEEKQGNERQTSLV